MSGWRHFATQDAMAEKEPFITTAARKPLPTLCADRFIQQWVVRDHEGKVGTVPGEDRVRATQRERSFPIEPVPGH